MANNKSGRTGTGTGKNLDRRGEGLNTGPVGNLGKNVDRRFAAILKTIALFAERRISGK